MAKDRKVQGGRILSQGTIYIQYQSKLWTHLLIQGFFFIFTIFDIVEITHMEHQNYEITHMESCSNQNSVKQIKTYFRF